VRIAYADPPYPGMSSRYGRREVRHDRLVAALLRFDAWALSTSSSALREVLPLCPQGTRVLAWCKSWCSWKPGVWPHFTWEPVLLWPKRPANYKQRSNPRDYHVGVAHQVGFFGSKPPDFCGWLFDCLGATPDDEFHDLFHGSGAVKRAWDQWCASARAGGPLFIEERVDVKPTN